ncbi:sigma factor-like helix-turn-helix DNA-binding protein [Inquilinus sp. OTU3971]|uniref:sigma factor-like helix-turn-helix DNA-binding protein n=1 Tax=Inquilinus sp. OTU3971 TaxID=3043855 RepID=UPI00313D0E8F
MARPAATASALMSLLRHYAFGLTGSTEHGERLVKACLELAPQTPPRFGDARHLLRLALLDELWRAVESVIAPALVVDRDVASVQQALSRLPARERQALLLLMIDSVSFSDAACVIGISQLELVDLSARARTMLDRTIEAHSTIPGPPSASL